MTANADTVPTSDTVLFTRDGHIAHVRLNRPASLNAIDARTDAALARIWREVDRDPEIRVAVLSAAGDRAFCAGGDLHDLDALDRQGIALGGGLTGVGGPLLTLRKPLVAAVHGHALGGGFELALCADLIVAASSTRFALPEARLGVIGHSGVLHRTMRQLPHRVALAMVLTGAPMTADEALRHGVVNEVVPDADPLPAAWRWAERLAVLSPLAIQAAKEAATLGLRMPLDEALATRYQGIDGYATSADHAEALAALAAKRPPVWAGR